RRCRSEGGTSERNRETPMPSTPYHCIAVRSAIEQYDIHIGPGMLTHVGAQVQALTPGRKAFVFSHPHLYKLYDVTLADHLRAAGFGVEACLIPEEKHSKTLLSASRLFTRLARGGTDRHSVVCALKKKVLGNVTRFVTATYM